MNSQFSLILASSVLFCGCATSAASVARTRAANEFGCPEENVTMTELSPGTEVVNACGHRVVYSCVHSGPYGRVCIREESSAGAAHPVSIR